MILSGRRQIAALSVAERGVRHVWPVRGWACVRRVCLGCPRRDHVHKTHRLHASVLVGTAEVDPVKDKAGKVVKSSRALELDFN